MKRNREEEEEEEEEGRLINAKVVEHLQPIMSRELLCKFPDNSAFDFDYSQSSIWSPLIPRTYRPLDLDSITPKKFRNDLGFGVVELERKKKKMVNSPAFGINLCTILKKKKKKKMKIKASEFSPTPLKNSCLPISTKGWAKMLKAASKHFKKKKKKKDTGMHVKLTNCLMK